MLRSDIRLTPSGIRSASLGGEYNITETVRLQYHCRLRQYHADKVGISLKTPPQKQNCRQIRTAALELFAKLWYNKVKKGGDPYMNFSHCDHDEQYLTLHDCIAERAYFENGKLGFEFDDGFWVSPDHPKSNLSELVRTDRSKVEYTLEDGEEYDVTVYVFKKLFFKKVYRNCIPNRC